MKRFLSLFLVLIVLSANAAEGTNDVNVKTEVFSKNKYKRAKRRLERRHGLYRSKCMRTKTIRVRN